MARRGFISPKVYLDKAYDRNIELAEAQSALVEALRLGRVKCEGRRRQTRAFDRLYRRPDERLVDTPRQGSSKAELIPASTWTGISESLVAEWDWESGTFVSHSVRGAPQCWDDIKLKEKQCNALLGRLEARNRPASPETISQSIERRRSATWDQWVAVVATLAYQHVIDANSTDRDILDLAAKRLGLLHDPGKQTKRMKSAAQAIVDHWKTNPPKQPAPARLEFSGPTQKP